MTACTWPGCETGLHPGRTHPERHRTPAECGVGRAPCAAPEWHHPFTPEPPTLHVCRVMQVDEDIYSGERAFTVHVEWPPAAAHMLPRVGSEVTVGPSPEAFFAWMRGSQAGKERIIAAAIEMTLGWSTGLPLSDAGQELLAAVRDLMGGK